MRTIDPEVDLWPLAFSVTLMKGSPAYDIFGANMLYGEERAGSDVFTASETQPFWKGSRWAFEDTPGGIKGCIEPSHGFDFSIADFFIEEVHLKSGVVLQEKELILEFLNSLPTLPYVPFDDGSTSL